MWISTPIVPKNQSVSLYFQVLINIYNLNKDVKTHEKFYIKDREISKCSGEKLDSIDCGYNENQ
jgi:hypothetical protein